MKTIIAASVLLATIAGTAGSALAMEQELTMLEQAVEKTLQQYDVQGVDVMNLNLAQLAQIRGIVEGDEGNDEKSRRIKAITEQ